MCRDGISKVKAQLELHLVRYTKSKSLYRYADQKSKIKDNGPPPVNKTGELVTTDMEKSDVLNNHLSYEEG